MKALKQLQGRVNSKHIQHSLTVLVYNLASKNFLLFTQSSAGWKNTEAISMFNHSLPPYDTNMQAFPAPIQTYKLPGILNLLPPHQYTGTLPLKDKYTLARSTRSRI